MANDFITMVTRVVTELRRSNLVAEAKNAINDAISEASKTRFYFNEMRGLTFPTVVGQEYYDDMGLVEIDTIYYFQGASRQNLYLDNNLDADERADGNQVNGQLQSYSRRDISLRLYPLPSTVTTIYVEGYGKLTPSPLVNDADTNAWMTIGERYIRALAKSIMWKDVIRDYGEATVADAMAEDLKQQLVEETNTRAATGTVRPTQW